MTESAEHFNDFDLAAITQSQKFLMLQRDIAEMEIKNQVTAPTGTVPNKFSLFPNMFKKDNNTVARKRAWSLERVCLGRELPPQLPPLVSIEAPNGTQRQVNFSGDRNEMRKLDYHSTPVQNQARNSQTPIIPNDREIQSSRRQDNYYNDNRREECCYRTSGGNNDCYGGERDSSNEDLPPPPRRKRPSNNNENSEYREPRHLRTDNKYDMRPMALHQALQTIPTFNGDSDKLAVFSKTVRDIVAKYGPQSERWVLNTLATKLTGRTADGYASRLTQYTRVESLLEDFNLQYSNVGGADHVLLELKTIKQGPNEGVGDYSIRVQKLHNRLLNIYDSDYTLEEFEWRTYKKRADRDALEQFVMGLRIPLEHQVRSRNPRDLREAITDAT